MSREIKRVPVDFDWPIGKVWEGYTTPERLQVLPCPQRGIECFNGQTRAGGWVMEIATMINLLDDRPSAHRPDNLHPYFDSIPTPYEWVANDPTKWPSKENGSIGKRALRPSDDIKEFVTGMCGREGLSPFGHDAIDRWGTYDSLVKAAGLDPRVWGLCPVCNGNASVEAYEGQEAEAEEWAAQDHQPPFGTGWQVWETVSEGAPVTPVFAEPEQLATYLVQNPRVLGSSGGGVSYEAALKFITGDGWIPSGINGSSGADLINKYM